MTQKLKVDFNGLPLEVEAGTPIVSLLKDHPHPGSFPPLGAVVNQRPVGLSYELRAHAHITTIDFSSREGMDIYRRTASLILYAALLNVDPKARIVVGQSLSPTAYFFELPGKKVDPLFLKHLQEEMQQLIKNDLPILIDRTSVEDAAQRLKTIQAEDQIKLLYQLRVPEAVLVHVAKYVGLVHGPIAHRTGVIEQWNLFSYEHGLALDFPDEAGNITTKLPPQPKLFAAYVETKRWNDLVGVSTVADFNEHCMQGDIADLIRISEALHEKKIAAIADRIAAQPEIKLILIAGPSSSGKTTFAKRLSIHLKIHGINPIAISLDNYYRPHKETPRHPDGSFDYEHIDALDLPHFNQNLSALLEGKDVELPTYSFQIGERLAHKAKRIQLQKGQVLITEGIHGLNERVSESIPHAQKFKIFVSALTQLCIDNHNRIFTTDARLCRRIVRDRLYRGSSAAETIALWPSVRHGEINYIFPFQEDADAIFNSALVYEHAVLKPFSERFLMEVPRNHPSFIEAMRLARFFNLFIPILPIEVPRTSIIREFIGDSAFRYG